MCNKCCNLRGLKKKNLAQKYNDNVNVNAIKVMVILQNILFLKKQWVV